MRRLLAWLFVRSRTYEQGLRDAELAILRQLGERSNALMQQADVAALTGDYKSAQRAAVSAQALAEFITAHHVSAALKGAP